MGSYVQGNLTNGEEVIVEAKVSWLNQLKFLLFGIIALIVAIAFFGSNTVVALVALVIAILFFASPYINVISTELVMTNKRVLGKFGFISRETCDICLDKIEGFSFSQGILERILGYGHIIVKGSGDNTTPFPCIVYPLNTNKKLNEKLDEFHEKAKSSN
ncbi:MAG: PH domain-containing protein [Campylobacter sp.]|nr:PH domain-containing protein [Campylobacter sp.]